MQKACLSGCAKYVPPLPPPARLPSGGHVAPSPPAPPLTEGSALLNLFESLLLPAGTFPVSHKARRYLGAKGGVIGIPSFWRNLKPAGKLGGRRGRVSAASPAPLTASLCRGGRGGMCTTFLRSSRAVGFSVRVSFFVTSVPFGLNAAVPVEHEASRQPLPPVSLTPGPFEAAACGPALLCGTVKNCFFYPQVQLLHLLLLGRKCGRSDFIVIITIF